MATPWEKLSAAITKQSDRIDKLPAFREATVDSVTPLSVKFDTDSVGSLAYRSLSANLAPGMRVLTIKVRHYIWILGIAGGDGVSANPVRVLWEGGPWYMIASQEAFLSSPVSEQHTGIVLHWQPYVGGVAENHNHNYTFVPKTHVQFNPGGGVRLVLRTSTTTLTKYVYVNNGSVVGNADNGTSPNTLMVITRIIGV